jgi:uncharacterized protein DUF1559
MQHGAQRGRCGKTLLWLLVGLLIGGAAGAGAVYVLKKGKTGIPGGPRLGAAEEVSMIPADSIAFVHIRARDIWKSEELADFRKVLDRAGPDALKMLDEGFVPAPSTMDRATLVVLAGPPPKGNRPGALGQPAPDHGSPIVPPENPLVVGILSFTAEFDANQVRAAYFPDADAKKENGKEFYVDEKKGLGIHFPNNKVMVVGMAAGVEQFVKKQTPDARSGPLADAIKLASEGGRHVVGAINMKQFQLDPSALLKDLSHVPPELRDLAKDAIPILRADAFAFALGVAGEDSRLDLRGYYKNEADAEAAEKGIRSAAEVGRKHLAEFKTKLQKSLAGPADQKKPRPLEQLPEALLAYTGIGGINTLDEFLANPPLKREGKEVVLSADRATLTNAVLGGYAAALGTLFDAVGKVRTAAARMKDSNNLKQIGLAMHNVHSAYDRFPSPDRGMDANAKPGLSWRVHILPFIEQEALYRQFKLDEPWDSEHNKKLIEKMPPTYASPLAMAPAGQTYYKVFSGKEAIFYPGSKTRITEIIDGTSNTIMIVEGGQPVVWTKPDDIPFDGKIDPKTLALPGQTGINIGMADGSVRWVDLSRLTPQKLAALITRAGGEVIALDDDGPGEAVPFVVPKAVQDAPKPVPTPKGAAPPPPKKPPLKD